MNGFKSDIEFMNKRVLTRKMLSGFFCKFWSMPNVQLKTESIVIFPDSLAKVTKFKLLCHVKS